MTADHPTCATCPYWADEGGDTGTCRRSSPRFFIAKPNDAEDAAWPWTDATEWCGEHPVIQGKAILMRFQAGDAGTELFPT